MSFDREQRKDYYITVIAEDGAKSDRPNHYPPGTPNQGMALSQIGQPQLDFRVLLYAKKVDKNDLNHIELF